LHEKLPDLFLWNVFCTCAEITEIRIRELSEHTVNGEHTQLIAGCENLNELQECIWLTQKKYFPQDNFYFVSGAGKARYPKIMGIFINPTMRNISSHPEWSGPRFPFAGINQFWRVMHRTGIFSTTGMKAIENSKHWTVDLARIVLNALDEAEVYLTNLVKRTYKGPQLPDCETVNIFLPILLKEIELIQPKYIVTFGRFPFFHLSGQKLKLDIYYRLFEGTHFLKTYNVIINSKTYKVIPCYFPVGRGNPVRSEKILERLWDMLKTEENKKRY